MQILRSGGLILGVLLIHLSWIEAALPSRFHLFAQVGDGGGIRSVFLIANGNDEVVTVQIEFFSSAGGELALEIDGATESSFERLVPAGGMLRLETAGIGAVAQAGWARITANDDVGVQLLFEIRTVAGLVTQAAVDSSAPLKLFDAFVEQNPSTGTGLALANVSTDGSVRIRIRLFNAQGEQVAMTELVLGVQQQIARFLSQLFQGMENFRGTMRVEASGPIAAVTLQQTGLVLGTLPILETL